MLRNYILIALRSLGRNRLFSFINIFGLALSMSVCMMIILRTKDQLSYDRFHPDAAHTFRITSKVTDKRSQTAVFASSPIPLAEKLGDRIPGETVVVYAAANQDLSYGNKTLKFRGAFTQPSFFQVFGFHLSEGEASTSLQKPFSIVLSGEMAERLFGREDGMGKLVNLDKFGSFLVTGILKTPEGKSHLDFDGYVSASTLPVLEKGGILPNESASWNPFLSSYTYIHLNKDQSVKSL